MPTLVINRTNEYANRWRAIDIYVDGQKIGGVSNGETKQFDISAGAHLVSCKIDWCGSNEVPVTVSDSKATLLTLSSGLIKAKYLFIVLALMLVNVVFSTLFSIIPSSLFLIYLIYKLSFGRNSYLKLKESMAIAAT
jgi:hypothetical protein